MPPIKKVSRTWSTTIHQETDSAEKLFTLCNAPDREDKKESINAVSLD